MITGSLHVNDNDIERTKVKRAFLVVIALIHGLYGSLSFLFCASNFTIICFILTSSIISYFSFVFEYISLLSMVVQLMCVLCKFIHTVYLVIDKGKGRDCERLKYL